MEIKGKKSKTALLLYYFETKNIEALCALVPWTGSTEEQKENRYLRNTKVLKKGEPSR